MMDARKFILNPEFKVERFDNEILLYAISSSKGIYLNETAYLVWQMCDNGHSVGEIIEILEKQYSQQKTAICGDIVAAVDSLIDSGALIATDG